MSELQSLGELAVELAEAARVEDPDMAARAERVGKRLGEGRFHVMVVGEFKRGKSTLVNALLGVEVLPTGVLPLTAVMTEVVHGQAGATVAGLDGTRVDVGLDDVARFVTEAGNPGNERGVDRVEVRVPAPLLSTGLVLVDTPGLGSIHLHNTEVGRASLLEADGAIVLLSADEPLSDEERQLLDTLAQRRARTFVVVNKADHLEPTELEEVRGFIGAAVRQALGVAPDLYCVSSRARAGEWDRFSAAFERFVRVELAEARLGAARAELGRIGEDLRDAVLLRRAALDLDVETLSERVEQFRSAADAQRAAFDEDRVLLEHDVGALMAEVGESLAAFRAGRALTVEGAFTGRGRIAVDRQARGWSAHGRGAVGAGELRGVPRAGGRAGRGGVVRVGGAVPRRTQRRVDAVRAAANDLFAIELPAIVVPAVSEERESFFYLFLHVGSTSEGLERAVRRLLPHRVVRRRMLARANELMVREFDKHAGRARWDLTQRLDGVRRRFEEAMSAELQRTVDAMAVSASRADQLRSATLADRDERSALDDEALHLAERAVAAAR